MNWTMLFFLVGVLCFGGGFALVLLCDYKKPLLVGVGAILLIAGGVGATMLVVKPETVARVQGTTLGAPGLPVGQPDKPDVSGVTWHASDPRKITFGAAPGGG